MRMQLRDARRCTRICRTNCGGDNLTPIRIGNSKHRNVSHTRMREQLLLDLGWVDVLAPANDHVFEPAGHLDIGVWAAEVENLSS